MRYRGVMNASDILRLRLHNTGLTHSQFKSAEEAVSHLCAVQAQDFAAAKWALGLRIKNSTDKDIEKAFNEGAILRTHVMRPTWHFVVPEDIRWILEQATLDGKTYWFSNKAKVTAQKSPFALLLSIYDEYTIAYKDRGVISAARDIERMISMGNALTAVIILNGKVAGTWNKALKKNTVEIKLSPFREFNKDEQEALESEVARYGKFFGIPAVLINNRKG